MATKFPYPPIDIPDIDIWDWIFEQDRDFLDERGIYGLP
jgi:4-coumarate--CoA ligase